MLAIVLEGVSEKWQMNVIQILGCQTSARLAVEGHGLIDAPAILLSQDQVRHHATQIAEILEAEKENPVH
jgi:hypothetical protein